MTLQASVVIPAYNAGDYIKQCLEGLSKQTLTQDAFEIILINDGATDNTLEEAKSAKNDFDMANLTIITKQNGGPASARNVGIKNANSGITVFLDSDCIPHPEWLETLIKPLHDNPHFEGVEGKTIPASEKRTPVDHYVESTEGGHYWTCNMAYRTPTLKKIGGFDEGFPWPSGEDIDIAERVKPHGTLFFEPEAIIEHLILSRSVKKNIAMAKTFSSMIRLWKKHPGLLVPEDAGFWTLVKYQFRHLIFPFIKNSNWLFKDPVVFFKLLVIHTGWVLDTLILLPAYYQESKEPLIIKEPFLPDDEEFKAILDEQIDHQEDAVTQ